MMKRIGIPFLLSQQNMVATASRTTRGVVPVRGN
jgi:predicted small secreted protein